MFTSGSLQLYYIIQSVITVSTSYAKCGGLCMGHKQYTRHSSLSLSLFRGARFSLVLRLQLPVQRIGSTFAVSCYHLSLARYLWMEHFQPPSPLPLPTPPRPDPGVCSCSASPPNRQVNKVVTALLSCRKLSSSLPTPRSLRLGPTCTCLSMGSFSCVTHSLPSFNGIASQPQTQLATRSLRVHVKEIVFRRHTYSFKFLLRSFPSDLWGH